MTMHGGDPEFDSVLNYSRELKLNDDLAIQKYYEFYEKTKKEIKDDYTAIWKAVSLTQDWCLSFSKGKTKDLEEIINFSRGLKVDEEFATKKFFEIYRYLRDKEEYKEENKCSQATIVRTKNYLLAYVNNGKKEWKNGDDSK